MSGPTMEKMFEIWDQDGWHFEVGPDRDGMDCIEIRYYEGEDAKAHTRISFPKATAALMAKALSELSE